MTSHRPFARWAVVLLAVLGGAVSATLLRMGSGPSGLSASLCSPSQSINCDYVLASPWAKVGPLPVAAAGLMYFAAMAAWYLVIGIPNAAGRRWHLVPLIAATLGLIGSAYYTLVMATRLPVWCTWCLAVHAVNALLFIFVLFAKPPRAPIDPAAPPNPSRARALTTLSGCGAGVVVIFLAVFAYQAQLAARRMQLELMEATNHAEYICWKYGNEPTREISFRESAPSVGPADAPHTVVAFTDFECRHCGWFHGYADHLAEVFPRELRIVFLHAPMCRECNPAVTTAFHFFACEAARAAEAARLAGPSDKAKAFRTLLYENSRGLASRPYAQFARAVGIDAPRFESALADEESMAAVRQDVDVAAALEVDATPSIWLDGRKLPTWHIMSDDPNPKISVRKTDELWRRLLDAATQMTPAESNQSR